MALFITFNSPNSVFASNLFLTFSVSYCDMGSVRSASISSRKAASGRFGSHARQQLSREDEQPRVQVSRHVGIDARKQPPFLDQVAVQPPESPPDRRSETRSAV